MFSDYTSEHELKEFITNKTRVVLGVGLIFSSINLYKDQVCLLGFQSAGIKKIEDITEDFSHGIRFDRELVIYCSRWSRIASVYHLE